MDVETASNYSSDFVLTPTNTHTSLPVSQTNVAPPSYRAAHHAPIAGPPYNGGTFVIYDLVSDLVLVETDGKPTLRGYSDDLLVSCADGRDSHWRCMEDKNRWLLFKNVVSGRFLEDKFNIRDFCVRHHVSGGYEILLKSVGGDGFRALEICRTGADNTLGFAEEGERGTLWKFLYVED